MIQLTVGYVAGFIALAIFVARLWAPNVITFIVSGILRDKNTAATWTVAAGVLQRSHWPNVLRSDSVKNRGVRKDVLILSNFITFMGILIAIAGVVTPLGLYEALVADKNVETPFQYLKDASPFGQGTPPRNNLTFNRICSGGFTMPWKPCPFTDTTAVGVVDSTGKGQIDYPNGYQISIPSVINDIYSSGVSGQTTVSNYFDIQWRRYQTTSRELFNNGTTYLVGAFRFMQSMVLNNAYEPVEGLIVDTVDGGIGFRNHTIPPGFQYGVSWDEDLLFIEPETECVNTNTTLDFSIAISPNTSTEVVDLVLTDRGGFVDINHTYPLIDLTQSHINPNLYERAHKAAWMTNFWTMLYYNITSSSNKTTGTKAFSYLNSNVGKTFTVANKGISSFYASLSMDYQFSSHLNIGGTIANTTVPGASGPPKNPFGVGRENFTAIHLICAGAGNADYANITNIFASCGLMLGVPQRQDQGSSILFEAGSHWSQPLYACASTVKATVKTVSFAYNGTDDLQSLKVTSIKKKVYSNNESKPLWGVEYTGNAYNMDQINLMWGLISPEYEKHPNVSSIRQESLYLPGYASRFGTTLAAMNIQNIPASEFYTDSMGEAYTVGNELGSSSSIDYSGQTNMALWARWQNLTRSTTTAVKIPNLIFTDFAAAAVVGTKGVLGPGNAAQKNVVPLAVTPTVRRIKYHWPFAIPALLTALCLIIITIMALVTLIFGHSSIAKMRQHLHQSSTGRIFTTFLFPGPGAMRMKTKDWSRHMGKTVIDLSGDIPMCGDAMGTATEKPHVYGRSVSGETSGEGDGFLSAQSPAEGYVGNGFTSQQGFVEQIQVTAGKPLH